MAKANPVDEFAQRLSSSLQDGTFVRLIFSRPVAVDDAPEQVLGRLITLKGGPHLFLTYRYATHDVTKNLPASGGTSVAVDGSGFNAGAEVQVQECTAEPGHRLCAGLENITVGVGGTFSTSVVVSYDMRGSAPPYCETS